jgi:hypothetical protein
MRASVSVLHGHRRDGYTQVRYYVLFRNCSLFERHTRGTLLGIFIPSAHLTGFYCLIAYCNDFSYEFQRRNQQRTVIFRNSIIHYSLFFVLESCVSAYELY